MASVRATAFVLLLVVSACSAEAPRAPIQHAPPLSFDVPTGTIAVAPVTVDLPARRGIGTLYRNVDCWVRIRSIMPQDMPDGAVIATEIERALSAAKLKVASAPAPDVGAAGGADYLLTAAVPSAHADLCVDNFFNEGPADVDAQVALSWHLWSVKDKRVVFETTTTGTARASDPAQTINAGVMEAVDDATRQLLQTSTTQQYLTYGRTIAPQLAESAAPAPVPPGGAAPIPTPPAGIRSAARPELPPILVPVLAARPPGSAVDAAAVRAATLPIQGAGAALVVGDGYLLTAAALTGDAMSVGVTMSGAEPATARVVRRDAEAGVALLKVDEELPASLPMQPRRNAPGDPVLGVGPHGLVHGRFTSTHSQGGSDKLDLAGALPGGPVLDPAGNVIGILLPDGGFASLGMVFRALQLGAQLTEG